MRHFNLRPRPIVALLLVAAALGASTACSGELGGETHLETCETEACAPGESTASSTDANQIGPDAGSSTRRDAPSESNESRERGDASEPTGNACEDGIDNDGDGKIDLEDDGCLASYDDSERYRESGDAGAPPGAETDSYEPVYRVNAGGPSLAGEPGWEADDASNPSPHLFGAGQEFGGRSSDEPAISIDESVPEDVPDALFESQRYDSEDPSTGGSGEMGYRFDVDAGTHEVRLYLCETWQGATETGVRTFDVEINGTPVLDDFDMYAKKGGYTGFARTFDVTTSSDDEGIEIEFLHESNNPMISGLEIRSTP